MTDQPTGPATDQDDALLAELGGVLRATDPVPEVLLEQTRDLLVWRDVDAQLQILIDSAGQLEGVRSAPVTDVPTSLTMQGPGGLVLAIESSRAEDGTMRLLGQVAGVELASAAVVAIRIGDRISHTTVDQLGTFTLEGLAPGQTRLLLQLDDEPLLTPWFEL